ncbi:MAG: hypothetical protein SFV15_16115 [Polyangiaceae bacterium]|nr:hypothetical protein [Polyangiaceae bacterium]
MSGHDPFGTQPPPGAPGAPPPGFPTSPPGYPPAGVPHPPHAAGYPYIPQHFIQPVRKDKTLLYVGLGCGGIVLFFVLSLVGLGVWGYFKAKSAIESAAQKLDHVRFKPGNAGAPATPECLRAIRCCQRVMGKLNNEGEYQKCETFLDSPDSICRSQLEAFSAAAKNLDITCEESAPAPKAKVPQAP